MTIVLSAQASNSQLDALAELLDDGYLRLYSGQRPASPDVSINGQLMLAELRFNKPAFSPAENGMLRAKRIKADPSAANSGQVGWYRAFAKDGKTAIIDGSVGTKDADMIVNITEIQKTASFSIQDYRLRTRNNTGQ